MPGAVEGEHHGHPDFRAGGRVFASLHPDGLRGMVRVSPDEQRRLVAHAAFTPANGAWGRAGCTMVVLADVPARVLEDAMALAWQATAQRPPSASAATRQRKTVRRSASSRHKRAR